VEALRLTVERALRHDRIALNRQDAGDGSAFHGAATRRQHHHDHQQGLSGSYSHDLSGS